MTPTNSVSALLAGAVFASASAAGADGTTAESTVYKCKDASGAVAYQDYPCKGGVIVELKLYAADPEAVRLLQQADADFNRAVARRKANDEIGPIRR
jgi:hypothetical protein